MLTDINQETEKIEGNSQQKQAILKLIEIKTDSDMREVITKMDAMQIARDYKCKMVYRNRSCGIFCNYDGSTYATYS